MATGAETIRAYADGGCRGNGRTGNIGGYGIVLEWKGRTREFSEGFRETTNNRMELLAALDALRLILAIPGYAGLPVELTSDSKYVIECFEKSWYAGWRRKGWKTSAGKPVKNRDLWEPLLEAKEGLEVRGAEVTFTHVLGHKGHPQNERCDELANLAMDGISSGTASHVPDTPEGTARALGLPHLG